MNQILFIVLLFVIIYGTITYAILNFSKNMNSKKEEIYTCTCGCTIFRMYYSQNIKECDKCHKEYTILSATQNKKNPLIKYQR